MGTVQHSDDDLMWDPNNWVEDHEHRIYTDDMAQVYFIVDAIDYHHFIKWCWTLKRSPHGKLYARRSVRTNQDRHSGTTMYLHIEIMKQAGTPLTEQHCIVDHKDGNSHNCRRSNLRWATKLENAQNRHGSYLKQLVLPKIVQEE